MTAMAYNSQGREIKLPKAGSVVLPAGTMVLRDGTWTTLVAAVRLTMTNEWDNGCQSHRPEEKMEVLP